MSVFFGLLVFIEPDYVFLGEGFCEIAVMYFPLLALTWLFEAIFLSVVLVFSILTRRFILQNTVGEDPQMKKAIEKILLFLFIESILDAISYLLPSLTPTFLSNSDRNNAGTLYLVRVILRIIFFIPQIFIPIVMIIILKPLREALKQGQRKFFICKMGSEASL